MSEQPAPQEAVALDKRLEWEKKCKASQGTMVLLPMEFYAEANENKKLLAELDELRIKFNTKNAEWTHVSGNFWFKVRKALLAAGMKDAFEKNVGWNTFADADGVRVVNITNEIPQ